MTNLREVRLQKGINQRQLAEATHTCQSLISSLERGVIKPWPKVADRLSKALRTPVGELFPDDMASIRK